MILVYDVSSPQSFLNLKKWLQDIHHNGASKIPLLLIGNKCDLGRFVTFAEAQEFATWRNLEYIETSAQDRSSVDNLFKYFVKRLRDTSDQKPLTPQEYQIPQHLQPQYQNPQLSPITKSPQQQKMYHQQMPQQQPHYNQPYQQPIQQHQMQHQTVQNHYAQMGSPPQIPHSGPQAVCNFNLSLSLSFHLSLSCQYLFSIPFIFFTFLATFNLLNYLASWRRLVEKRTPMEGILFRT